VSDERKMSAAAATLWKVFRRPPYATDWVVERKLREITSFDAETLSRALYELACLGLIAEAGGGYWRRV